MLFWSSGLPVIALGLKVESPFAFLIVRFLLSSILIFLYAVIRKAQLLFSPKIMLHLFFNSLFVFSQFIFFYHGLKTTAAQRSNIIINLNPVIIILFAHFFFKDERLTKTKFIGTIVAFSGVFYLFFEKNLINSQFLTGDFMILCAAVSIACSTLYTRYMSNRVNLIALLFWQIFYSAIVVFFIMKIFGIDFGTYEKIGKLWHIYLYLSVFTNIIAPLLWFWLISHYKLSKIAVISFIFPIMSAFFCYMILNEPLSGKLWFSLFLVTAGISIVQWKTEKKN